jgi:peptidyl-prolyl cis-trans isomerase B (cyclophilin B)
MIWAKLYTNRGEINLELDDEKAPLSVANFVNLSIRSFYDQMPFYRCDSEVVQSGCPIGSGTGNPGYRFAEHAPEGMNFNRAGVIAFSRAPIGEGFGSQFFITRRPLPWFNHKHVVFGSLMTRHDQAVVDSLIPGDTISQIHIDGRFTPLLMRHAKTIANWNAVLEEYWVTAGAFSR